MSRKKWDATTSSASPYGWTKVWNESGPTKGTRWRRPAVLCTLHHIAAWKVLSAFCLNILGWKLCPRFWLVWPCIDAQVNQVVDSELLTPITSAQELPVCNWVIWVLSFSGFFGIYLPLQFHTGFWYCCDSAIYQPEASFICSFDWPKDFEILLKQWPNLDLSILCHCFHRHSWYLYEALASQKEDLRRCLASYQARRFENRWAATISTLCRTRQGNDGEWLSRSRRSHCQVGSRTVISGMRQGIGATVAWSISWPFVACLRYSQPENRMPFCWSTKECFLSFEIYREYYIMNITCTMIMYDVVIQSFTAFRFSWLCS